MPPPRKRFDVWSRVAIYSGFGMIIPSAVVAGYLIGRFLDATLHTQPILALVFSLAGAGAGTFEVIRLVTRMEENAANDDSEDGKG